jgi:hypothetical protein
VHGLGRAEAKTQALYRWRDRLHEAQRQMAALQAQETWLHGLWRKRSKRHPLELTAPQRVEPVIDEFRREVTRHGKPPVRVHDPTRLRFDELLDLIPKSPLEPAEPPEPVEGADFSAG